MVVGITAFGIPMATGITAFGISMAVGITAFGIPMAVDITAFGDSVVSFPSTQKPASLTISLLPPPQLMWSLTQTLLREWLLQRLLEGQEQCRQVWSLLLSPGQGSRATCHGSGKQLDPDPSQRWKEEHSAVWVAEAAGRDPGWAPTLQVQWLGSHQPRQRQ